MIEVKKPAMQLTRAEPADFIQIAKDMYDLWSAGLTKDFYRHFLWSTCYQPWAKRNHHRLVAKDKETVTVSCKVVHLPLACRGKHFKILGLGAIFTTPAYRGRGLATNLIQSMIKTAKQENIDRAFFSFQILTGSFMATTVLSISVISILRLTTVFIQLQKIYFRSVISRKQMLPIITSKIEMSKRLAGMVAAKAVLIVLNRNFVRPFHPGWKMMR